MPVNAHLAADVLADRPSASVHQDGQWLDVTVAQRDIATTDIVSLELICADGCPLPAYDAGAQVRIGRTLNNLNRCADASHTVLFAGGIGITPILNMAYTLRAVGASWELHYCGRTSDRLAFTSELKQFGDRVQMYIDSGPDDQKLDTNSLLSNADAGQHLYVWGPNDFMEFVVESAENDARNTERVHLEPFGAEVTTDGAPFTVFTRMSGKTFGELPEESISKKLAEHGIHVQVSCQSGVCGSCLTRVLEGTPDHLNLVHTDQEKASNTQITVCCSRSKRKKLVLDL